MVVRKNARRMGPAFLEAGNVRSGRRWGAEPRCHAGLRVASAGEIQPPRRADPRVRSRPAGAEVSLPRRADSVEVGPDDDTSDGPHAPRARPSVRDPVLDVGHPRAFWFFFWGEFAERCSYYGMRAILPLYMTSAGTSFHFSDQTGSKLVFAFKMACYFLPLLGGFLADRFFGKYWTIVGFSVPYVAGHFILGIPNDR